MYIHSKKLSIFFIYFYSNSRLVVFIALAFISTYVCVLIMRIFALFALFKRLRVVYISIGIVIITKH